MLRSLSWLVDEASTTPRPPGVALSRPVIWLNRNYATTIHLIEMLKDNPEGRDITVLASHRDPSSPMLAIADRQFVEPDSIGVAYAEHALRFCLDHQVTVFLPVYQQRAVVARAMDFASAGVGLLAPDAATVELFDDKVATYEAVGLDSAHVPPFRQVRTVDELLSGIAELSADGATLVIKPARGVGAEGVRMLTDSRPTLAELAGPVTHSATVDDFVRAMTAELQPAQTIAGVNPIPDSWILMPYLSEPEISVDVLADRGSALAVVPRTKIGRDRSLAAPDDVMEAARELVGRFRLHGLANIQFRYHDQQPVLLEINTRPSGGLYQTRLAGVNLPWSAVKLALGEPVGSLHPQLGARYTTVSSVVSIGTR